MIILMQFVGLCSPPICSPITVLCKEGILYVIRSFLVGGISDDNTFLGFQTYTKQNKIGELDIDQ